MKVCIIASIFHPYTRGGAEVVAQNAAMAFKQAGDEVFVITTMPWQGWSSLWPIIEEWQGIRIYRYYPLNIFSFLNIDQHNIFARFIWHVLDMFNLHTYFVARDILLEEKPHCIMTHNLKGLGYTVHLSMHHPAFLIYHPQWLHTIHDIGAIHPTGLLIHGQENAFLQKFFLARWYARINAKLLGSPNWVISPSQFLLDYYIQHGFFLKSKKVVIRNPVLREVAEEPCESEVTEETFATSATFDTSVASFLYLGQLEPYKGLPLLLDMWQEFSKTHPDRILHIAGRGSMEARVKKSASANSSIIFHGFIPHEQIGTLLRQTHFVIIPSLAYESASMGVAESFTHGVPVIASRLGAIPEIVQDGQNGFLFTPGDRSDLLRVMQSAVDCDWQSLSKRAVEGAAVFSVVNYIKSVKDLCQES